MSRSASRSIVGRPPFPDDGRYRLGVEAARIGSVYQQSFAPEERVVPVLERLVAESMETASFYIRRGNQRLCLFRADSP